METLFRHGDLLLKKTDYQPDKKTRMGGNVLAEGEVTGHSHKLVGDFQFYGENEIQWVQIGIDGASIVHEEHKKIDILPGMYELIHEREFSPFEDATRRVID